MSDVTGTRIWASSHVLFAFLCNEADAWFCSPLRGSVILELGAGTGALALRLHAVGARFIVATDTDERIEQTTQKVAGDAICVRAHYWGDMASLESALAAPTAFDRAVDFVIVGDPLYWPGLAITDEDTLDPLARSLAFALQQCASHRGALAFESRDLNREAQFFSLLADNGVTVLHQRTVSSGCAATVWSLDTAETADVRVELCVLGLACEDVS